MRTQLIGLRGGKIKYCIKCKMTHSQANSYCFNCGSLLIGKDIPKYDECNNSIFGRYCAYCGQKTAKIKNV